MRPNALGLTLDDYRTALRNGARGLRNVHVLEGESLLPAKKHHFFDDLHPNNEGMALYGANLAALIKQVLQE